MPSKRKTTKAKTVRSKSISSLKKKKNTKQSQDVSIAEPQKVPADDPQNDIARCTSISLFKAQDLVRREHRKNIQKVVIKKDGLGELTNHRDYLTIHVEECQTCPICDFPGALNYVHLVPENATIAKKMFAKVSKDPIIAAKQQVVAICGECLILTHRCFGVKIITVNKKDYIKMPLEGCVCDEPAKNNLNRGNLEATVDYSSEIRAANIN